MPVRRVALGLLLGLAASGVLQAQGDPAVLGAAIRAEGEGRLVEAFQSYRLALAAEPGSAPALLGLQRVAGRLGWTDSLRPHVARAIEAAPTLQSIREVEFQVATTGGSDSVQAAARRWIAALPTSPTPYRRWSFWLAQRGMMSEAERVLVEGQERLGDWVLAPDLAAILVATGDWVGAARQWSIAVSTNGALLPAAVTGLEQAPEASRDPVLEGVLAENPAPPAQWLAADLLVRWRRPAEGWPLLDAALPEDRVSAIALLRRFAALAAQAGTPQGSRVRGYALERVAELSWGLDADRARLLAAQAFAEAGDLPAAERLLNRLAAGTEPRSPEAAAAMAAFIGLLADAGLVDQAEDRFREWLPRMSGGDVAQLRIQLAWARVLRGELDRAERLLEGASTVGADAVAGWVALYRGELAEARARFRAAGPYGEERWEATRRATLLVLLERVEAERLPELGSGLLAALRGDTARAVRELERVAGRLPPHGGRADVLILAAELAVRHGELARAEPLLLQAVAADSGGAAAPTAEYNLAALYVELGLEQEATRRLERIILTYPESAVVPQARRLLDLMRGAIPES